MIVPENGSTPDQLCLAEIWDEYERVRQSRRSERGTSKASPFVIPLSTIETRPTPRNTDGFAIPTVPASMVKLTAEFKRRRTVARTVNKIKYDRLISTRHLRKTPAEDEIAKGEIDIGDIFFDMPRAQDPPAMTDENENQDREQDNPAIPTTQRESTQANRRIRRKKMCVSIDFYTDKFGLFRTTHRNSGGMYVTVLNLDYTDRDQPRNHHLLGFTPFGTDFEEAAKPIMVELRHLSKGKYTPLPTAKLMYL